MLVPGASPGASIRSASSHFLVERRDTQKLHAEDQRTLPSPTLLGSPTGTGNDSPVRSSAACRGIRACALGPCPRSRVDPEFHVLCPALGRRPAVWDMLLPFPCAGRGGRTEQPQDGGQSRPDSAPKTQRVWTRHQKPVRSTSRPPLRRGTRE